MYVDSHCHLDFPELSQRLPAVLANMESQSVSHALCISVQLEHFPRVLALAEQHPQLYATVGVHPDQQNVAEPSLEQLLVLADHPKVVGIGETGLDYYWHKNVSAAANEWQRERFRIHIRAARACGKPLIIHTRESATDTLRLMREEGADIRTGAPGGVMHCFTETWEVAQEALQLGFYISFSGIVTFKNAVALKEVAQKVPLERLLIETDSPYLAPVPHRGQTNEPGFVPYVAAEIARLKKLPLEIIAQASADNFFTLFRHAKK
jgi:TatD DNase family protein